MDRRGTALVEVVVATLLVAVAVSAMSGALLSSGGQSNRAQDEELASVQLETLLAELRNFVTSDPTPSPDSVGAGPDIRGNYDWRLEGDACGCWALDETRAHDVTSRLPAEFRARHPEARLTYTVRLEADETRRVDAHLDWNP